MNENDDMAIRFTPQAHDVRVERGCYVYYVRAVKRRFEPFLFDASDPYDGSIIGNFFLGYVCQAIVGKEKNWKVGIIRFRSDHSGRIRVIFRQDVPPGERVEDAIAALCESIRSGKYDDCP